MADADDYFALKNAREWSKKIAETIKQKPFLKRLVLKQNVYNRLTLESYQALITYLVSYFQKRIKSPFLDTYYENARRNAFDSYKDFVTRTYPRTYHLPGKPYIKPVQDIVEKAKPILKKIEGQYDHNKRIENTDVGTALMDLMERVGKRIPVDIQRLFGGERIVQFDENSYFEHYNRVTQFIDAVFSGKMPDDNSLEYFKSNIIDARDLKPFIQYAYLYMLGIINNDPVLDTVCTRAERAQRLRQSNIGALFGF